MPRTISSIDNRLPSQIKIRENSVAHCLMSLCDNLQKITTTMPVAAEKHKAFPKLRVEFHPRNLVSNTPRRPSSFPFRTLRGSDRSSAPPVRPMSCTRRSPFDRCTCSASTTNGETGRWWFQDRRTRRWTQGTPRDLPPRRIDPRCKFVWHPSSTCRAPVGKAADSSSLALRTSTPHPPGTPSVGGRRAPSPCCWRRRRFFWSATPWRRVGLLGTVVFVDCRIFPAAYWSFQ
mmetsp:Transcript_29841/g.72111  ORF Transcript_29841/g.72111 Transcript_29841/m.72111 type:complete len:232 (+) Transcript_29841:150-845(+)